MKYPILILFVLIVLLFGLAGCSNVPTPADARAVLSATKETAQAVAAVEATQPGGAPIAKAANTVAKGVDSVSPIIAKVELVQADVGTLKTSVESIGSKTDTLGQKVEALGAAVKAGASITHTVAPGTPVDTYATAAVAAITLLSLVGKILDHKQTQTAITTPGTTTAPEAKG